MRRLVFAATTAALCIFASSAIIKTAEAATLVFSGAGRLVGATNVDVNGTPYDVQFVLDSCVNSFDGCNSPSDFAFNSPTSATAAANALLDQVFLDGPLGAFDSFPSLTFGCNVNLCRVLVPYAATATSASYILAQNAVTSDTISGGPVPIGLVFSDADPESSVVWARFSPAAIETPLPAALPLFATILAGAGLVAWRRRRKTLTVTD